MNAIQSNKLSMLKGVLAFLLSLPATSVPKALAAKLTLLKTLIARIIGLNDVQTTPNDTAGDPRDEADANLIEATLSVAGPVRCYALSAGRTDLVPLVDLVPSDFHNMRIEERSRLAKRVLEEAQLIVADLADYDVTAETLTALQGAIDENDKANDAKRTLREDKKSATSNLAKAFTSGDKLIDEIDSLLDGLRQKDPDAFARYQIARQIVDRPGTRHEEDTPTPPNPAPASASNPAPQATNAGASAPASVTAEPTTKPTA